MKKKFDINSPVLHVVMYALLLFFTPFIMLRNFLQDAIGRASAAGFELFGLSVPYVLVLAVIVLGTIFYRYRREITPFRITALGIIFLMWFLGQKTADYYFNHKFYELQHNWHYIAYALFVLLIYRASKIRGIKRSRFALWGFLLPLFISALDEFLQVFISSRVFDIGDIAKDSWGAVIGIVFAFFVIESGKIVRNGWQLRHSRLKGYLQSPWSITVLSAIFAYSLLFFGSLLTDIRYILPAVSISIGFFVIVFGIIHLSQNKPARIVMITAAVVLALSLTASFVVFRDDNMVLYRKGFAIYKGIPIPYFDFMIFPNGFFRPVDKKLAFNQRDMLFLHELASDILIIGSGSKAQGGKGFPKEWEAQFIFNPKTGRGLQVIIQRTHEACVTFNRLKKEGKNVLFVVHNA